MYRRSTVVKKAAGRHPGGYLAGCLLTGISIGFGFLPLFADAVPTAQFESPAEHYSIQFPADWSVQKQFVGISVMALSPENQTAVFRNNCNVVVSPIEKGMSLETDVGANLNGMKQLLTDFEVKSTGVFGIADSPAASWIAYRHRMGSIVASALASFSISSKRQSGFVVTCSSDPKSFEQHLPLFKRIAESLKIAE